MNQNQTIADAIIDALTALQNGDNKTAAPACAKVMRLLSEAILPQLRAGTFETRVMDRRHVWLHPNGFDVVLSPCGSLGFAATIAHALGTIEGGFKFLDDSDNRRLREALK